MRNYGTGLRCNPRPVTTGCIICICDWLRDATGLDFGDRSWICNAAQDVEHSGTLLDRDGQT